MATTKREPKITDGVFVGFYLDPVIYAKAREKAAKDQRPFAAVMRLLVQAYAKATK